MCCLSWVAHTQSNFFIETGVNAQILLLKVQKSPALAATYELIYLSRGNPKLIFPKKRVTIKNVSPKINIGYKITFDNFNILLSIGTSQDFDNTFKLSRIIAVKGKNYPIPESFNIKLQGYKTLNNGLVFGANFLYDNQKSEFLLNNSNLHRDVIGLLNQISNNINLLGIGTSKYIQMNGIIGWEKSKNKFQINTLCLIGKAGKAIGVQLDVKIRYSF